jgi:hypothetical protein
MSQMMMKKWHLSAIITRETVLFEGQEFISAMLNITTKTLISQYTTRWDLHGGGLEIIKCLYMYRH